MAIGGNVLKNMKKIASNVYWLPRRASRHAQDIDNAVKDVQPDAIVAEPDAVLPSRRTRFQPPLFTEGQSVKAFFLEVMEYAAGNDLRVKHVEHSYQQLAIERRWAAISMKALSMHLVALGCKRRRVGPKRETYLSFPKAKDDTP